MSETFPLLSLLGAQIAATIAPGPTTMLIIRESTLGARRTAILLSAGVVLANALFIGILVSGLASVQLFDPRMIYGIRAVGSMYLVALGVELIRSKKDSERTRDPAHSQSRSLLTGFTSAALNPKAITYYAVLGTQVSSHLTSQSSRLLYALALLSISLIWFIALPFLGSSRLLRERLLSHTQTINCFAGSLIIVFAIGIWT